MLKKNICVLRLSFNLFQFPQNTHHQKKAREDSDSLHRQLKGDTHVGSPSNGSSHMQQQTPEAQDPLAVVLGHIDRRSRGPFNARTGHHTLPLSPKVGVTGPKEPKVPEAFGVLHLANAKTHKSQPEAAQPQNAEPHAARCKSDARQRRLARPSTPIGDVLC